MICVWTSQFRLVYSRLSLLRRLYVSQRFNAGSLETVLDFIHLKQSLVEFKILPASLRLPALA